MHLMAGERLAVAPLKPKRRHEPVFAFRSPEIPGVLVSWKGPTSRKLTLLPSRNIGLTIPSTFFITNRSEINEYEPWDESAS